VVGVDQRFGINRAKKPANIGLGRKKHGRSVSRSFSPREFAVFPALKLPVHLILPLMACDPLQTNSVQSLDYSEGGAVQASTLRT
jgi:hypothetical protein